MQSDFHPLPSVFNGETMGWQTTAPYGQDQGDKSENPNQLRFVVAEAIALLWAPDKIHFQRVWAARPFILNLLHTEPTPSQQEAEGAAAQQELQHSRCAVVPSLAADSTLGRGEKPSLGRAAPTRRQRATAVLCSAQPHPLGGDTAIAAPVLGKQMPSSEDKTTAEALQ